MLLILSMLLVAAGLVSAVDAVPVVTVTVPGAAGTMIGNYNVTVTVVQSNDTVFNTTWCNVSMTSASTANTSIVWAYKNASRSLGVANQTWIIGPIDTLLWEDSNDYTVRVTCRNVSGTYYNGSMIGITINNHVPTVVRTWPSDGLSFKTNNSITISATINATTSTGTPLVVWRDSTPTGHAQDGMSCTDNDCTLSLTNMPDGDYYWTITATDGTDTSKESYWHFLFDFQGKTGASKAIIYATAAGQDLTGQSTGFAGLPPIVKILLVGVIIYGIVQLTGKKGKKK